MAIDIKYICPFWGREHLSADAFVDRVTTNDFQGIEVHLPEAGLFKDQLLSKLEDIYEKNPAFIFIPQYIMFPGNEKIDDYLKIVEAKLFELAACKPTFINSHTGTDYFSFDDNCRVIETCMNVSSKTGVRILHETHRGRFSFHAATLIPYLEKFPELELTGDLSHFCTVSESLLQQQESILKKIFQHVSYIHARVGHEQGPQVNNPFAPEWENHLRQFTRWWDEIIILNRENGKKEIAICPEFGPAPYMPCLPFTKEPLADQWEIIVSMKKYIKEHFKKTIA